MRLRSGTEPAAAGLRHHDRYAVLDEADAAEVGLARHAFDALAVVQHDHLRAAALQHALLRPGGGRDLDAIVREPLHEDVDRAGRRPERLRVEHGLAVGVGAERARLQHAELGVAHAAAAQLLGAVARGRTDHEREPAERDRERQGERVNRQVQPLRAEAAGPHRGHLAFVIEPAEGQHHREQHADRHQHHQVLEGREADQREHDVMREAAFGGDPEDARELVAHEDRQQHAVTAASATATSRRT